MRKVFVHQLIEDLGGPHGQLGLDWVHLVVATNVTGRALTCWQVI